MAFILNPCHLLSVSIDTSTRSNSTLFSQLFLIIIGFSKFSIFTQLLALYVFALSFGGWLGIIFSENHGLPFLEELAYQIEHYLGAFGGILILYLSGRFRIVDYYDKTYMYGGLIIYAIWMRYVLTPVSLYTWVNLNHDLCSCDNDPVAVNFNLGWTYFFWCEFYSFALVVATFVVNCAICCIVGVILKKFGCKTEDKDQKEK